MTLIPWKHKREDDPDRPSALAGLRSEMDRLFEAVTGEGLGGFDWPFRGGADWAPAIDVAEDEREVTVRAEVPGMAPEDIEVTVSGGQLILAGEKKESVEHREKDFHQAESRYGAFRRSVPLPEAVDPERVRAEYANGVLTVSLPKGELPSAKKITVKGTD